MTGAAAAALFVFRLLRQPPILGFLLAGIIIGPYTFKQLAVLDTESIRRIADLGLVVLLFALGIEFGWDRIRRVGLRVVFIAGAEVAFMVWLGYQVGLAMGWSNTEAFFLGSALSISSSAVLARLLRDSGQLSSRRGQLIIGILVIEDFAAVVLLSVLTGVATTGVSDMPHIGELAGKLAIFAIAALVLGTLIVPRLFALIERLGSSEMLLLAGLGLCFGIAELAAEFELSAAAGAFLIGTVVGDSAHSQLIERMTAPVRDLFGAIFFVSIGMLVNFAGVGDWIAPAIIVIVVFMAGKLIIVTVATFLAGEGPKTAVEVGTGMPQLGEFSLAMVKVGADRGVLGAAVNPVITVTTVVTSFLVPFTFRAAAPLTDFVSRRSPALLKAYLEALTRAMQTARTALAARGAANAELRRDVRTLLVNLGVIAVTVAAGTLALGFTDELAGRIAVAQWTASLIIGGLVLALCAPSVVIIVRTTSDMGERLAQQVVMGLFPAHGDAGHEVTHQARAAAVARVIRLSVRVILVAVALLWALPFILGLFAPTAWVWPVVVFIAVAIAYFMVRTAGRIRSELAVAFERKILGE
jgi:CPA2 family monovalent cation:H+ antiporter-2